MDFRAWDSEQKRMGRLINWNTDGEVLLFDNGFTWKSITPDIATIMQFIGLCDKCGVKIYQGDVIKYNHIDTAGDIWIVDFYKGEFVLRQNFWKISIRSLMFKNNLEVIGDIYRNPELINTEKGGRNNV